MKTNKKPQQPESNRDKQAPGAGRVATVPLPKGSNDGRGWRALREELARSGYRSV